MVFAGMDLPSVIVRRDAHRNGDSLYHIELWRSASYGLTLVTQAHTANECSLEKRSAIPSESMIAMGFIQTLIDHDRSDWAPREHHRALVLYLHGGVVGQIS